MATANPAATASWPTPRWVVPRTRPSKNNSWARVSRSRHSCINRYSVNPVSRSSVAGATVTVAIGSRSISGGDELPRLRPDAGDLVRADTRPHQLDRRVDPLARPLVRVALGVCRGADRERPVIAGLVADERVDDVEEGLIARPDQPVAEDVRVRAAALAGHGVDVVDVLGPHLEQSMGDIGDQLVLTDAGLEVLGDVLVRTVDHGAGRVQQDDLVDRLDLARVEHDLLGVADGESLRLERDDHRRLDDVDAQ